ncbi:MAG: hypothetical protein JNL02_09595 [Saprospiraceae bacterium]|nr:hypothetical protein [Saprospiraceae bacterium]
MAIENLFYKLEKLKIKAFLNAERRGMPEDEIEVMFNPTSYAMTYSNKFEKTPTAGQQNREAKYTGGGEQQLTLDLFIDGTGVSDMGIESLLGIGTPSVEKQVAKFMRYCYQIEEEIHQPYFLTIEWGNLRFDCRMSSVNITYSLFDQAGKPLRAKLNATFIEALSPEKAQKSPEGRSSDLTKAVQVKMEDTLLLLTKQVYGSMDYYTWVARYNDLDQFRKLQPGSQLVFPPLETLKAKYEQG